MDEKVIHVCRYRLSETDIVRAVVIISLVICCTITTALSFSRSFGLINYQLFFIPILYAAYFYPDRGLLIAALSGIIYQAIGYYYRYPDPVALVNVTSEAVLFVIVAGVITYFIERIRSGEARYRTVFEHSQLGIVLFTRTDFIITQTNDKFCDMLHYSPEEVKTITFSDLFLNPQEKNRFLERIGKHESTENFETRFRTHEGDGCWGNLSWSSIDEKTISCTAVNINSRKLAEKLNNDNMMKYRQLTENSPTAILIIQNGVIRFTNPSFATFSGYTAAEVSGRELSSFIDPRDLDTFLEFSRPWAGKAPRSGQKEFRFVTKEGGIRVAVLFANPIMHFNKPAMMINLVDISEKLRLEEQIQIDNERRRGIITTVAHELRTPLQPILGYLNLLVQDPEGFGILDDTKKILERCLMSVERERQIINQMLELSILESGKLHLSNSRFLLVTLVNSVLDTSGYLSKAEVTIDIPNSLTITADMDRLYSVLDALLSNAINYTKPPRKIKIFYYSGINDKQHHISVQDNGIGIEESSFASIFEPFQLADAAKLSRKYDRIGLSLSIAKKVIQMHGGDITVESHVNSGSTFTLHLPKEVPL